MSTKKVLAIMRVPAHFLERIENLRNNLLELGASLTESSYGALFGKPSHHSSNDDTSSTSSTSTLTTADYYYIGFGTAGAVIIIGIAIFQARGKT